MRRQAARVVLRKDRNDLRFEHAGDVAGHGSEQAAARRSRCDPRRHRGSAGAQLHERAGKGFQQLVDVEQTDDVGLAEEEEASACAAH